MVAAQATVSGNAADRIGVGRVSDARTTTLQGRKQASATQPLDSSPPRMWRSIAGGRYPFRISFRVSQWLALLAYNFK